MKVRNMQNSRGNTVANQFIITTEGGEFFQSYKSMIAFRSFSGGALQLDEKFWDYSVTTSRHRNNFTGLNTAETKRAIASGEIILTNLNGA